VFASEVEKTESKDVLRHTIASMLMATWEAEGRRMTSARSKPKPSMCEAVPRKRRGCFSLLGSVISRLHALHGANGCHVPFSF